MIEAYTVTLYKSDGEALVCTDQNRFRITMADYIQSGIADGATVDEESLIFIEEAAEKLACIKKAFVYLSYRSLPIKKLKSKLKIAGFCDTAVEKTIELLLKKGYLDDDALCLEYAESLRRSKLFGAARIKKELFAKGFDAACIDQALDSVCEENCNDDVILQLLSKKFPSLDPNDREGRAKAVAYLYRMGYTYDDINNAMSALGRD